VLVQAVIAGALSFAHLHDLADAAGQHGWKSWAYPISVDLLLVAAWRRLRSRHTDRPVLAVWAWFTVALTASLGANIATAGLLDLHNVPAWLRILVAGWPALAFLGGTLLAHTTPDPAPAPAPLPEPAPAGPTPATGPAEHDAPGPVDAPTPTPELPPAHEPEPAPATASAAPAVVVPPALLEHARRLADTHHAATGHRIDAPTLRARLGLPGPLADAITAQLA
jgi:hypothetical protein